MVICAVVLIFDVTIPELSAHKSCFWHLDCRKNGSQNGGSSAWDSALRLGKQPWRSIGTGKFRDWAVWWSSASEISGWKCLAGYDGPMPHAVCNGGWECVFLWEQRIIGSGRVYGKFSEARSVEFFWVWFFGLWPRSINRLIDWTVLSIVFIGKIDALQHHNIVQAAVGSDHSLVLSDGGQIFSWGTNAAACGRESSDEEGYRVPK